MNPEKRLLQIVTGGAVVVVLLHLVFAFWQVPAGWGVHALAFFPAWASCGAAALALALLLPPVSERGVRMLSGARVGPWVRSPHLRYGLIGLLSVIPFYLLRVRVQTVGDGPLWVRELTGPLGRLASEPLTIALVRFLYTQMGEGGWGDALRVYQVLSWACGALYVFLTLLMADAVGRDRRERTILRLSLLTLGTVALFCGYAEHYAPLTVALLAFLYTAWRYLEGRGPLAWPALIWAVAFALHFSAVLLLPSLMLLYFIAWRRSPSRAGFWVEAAIPGAAILALFWLIGFDPQAQLRRLGTESHAVPLLNPDPFLRPHTLLSPVHLADVANLNLLVAPMGLLLIGAIGLTLRDRIARNPSLLLLGFAAFFYGLFTVVFNPEIGAFRDWDLSSPGGLPTILLAGYLLTRCAEPGTQRRLAWVVGVVAFFHLIPWLWVNADPERALARFSATLKDGSRLSVHARGSGYDELRGIYERLGRKGEALEAAKASLEAHPRHPRYLSNVVRLTDEAGGRETLEPLLKEILTRDPGFAGARVHLAALYHRNGRRAESEGEYRAAIAADPRDASARTGLGLLLYAVGRMEEGAGAFEAAIPLDPGDPVPFAKLGLFYQDHGQGDRGIEAFRQAIALKPDYAEARVNLGIALYRAGRLDEGEMELIGVLRADPNNGPARNALAVLYKDRGRLDDAIRLLEEALRTDPGNESVLNNLSSSYFLKGDLESAVRMSERLLEVNPKDKWALYNLCALYIQMGKEEEAKRWARRYVETFPDAPQAQKMREMVGAGGNKSGAGG